MRPARPQAMLIGIVWRQTRIRKFAIVIIQILPEILKQALGKELKSRLWIIFILVRPVDLGK